MNNLTIDDLKMLMTERQGPCISIMMPVRKGADAPKNEIRLKDQIKAVERKLVQRGMANGAAEIMMAPAYEIARDDEFWSDPGEGLALFITPNEFHVFMLPSECREMASVSNHFSVRGLLPGIMGDGRFYVLAVSQNDVRLLEASHYTFKQVPLDRIPNSVREMMKREGMEEHEAIQFHTGTNTPGRNRQGMEPGGVIYNGQGAGDDDDKIRIAEFFNLVDREVRRLIDDGSARAPMVLAGVEFLHPIYREQSEYGNLITGQILGNHDDTSDADLHTQAWEIVAPLFRQDFEHAKEAYNIHKGRGDGLSADTLEDIIPAAAFSRIAALIYNPNVDRWGTFNAETGEVTVHDQPTAESEDLVDLAVYHTLMNGGTVFASDEVPGMEQGGGLAVASFRF